MDVWQFKEFRWWWSIQSKLLLLVVLAQNLPTRRASDVCEAGGNCKEVRYLFCSFNYRNGLGDQRLLWFQTALKLSKALGRTLVLPPFWVPDVDGDSYQEGNAHFEPFENLYDPAAFTSYTDWIPYRRFREIMQDRLDLIYISPREAKDRHGLDCDAGQAIRLPGSMTIFGDEWQYNKIKCLETRDMMAGFLRSTREVLALNTRNNQELPGYRVEVLPVGECSKQWPFEMAFNATLVDAAVTFMNAELGRNGSFIAIHWRHGTSMHKESSSLVQDVVAISAQQNINPERVFLSTNCEAREEVDDLQNQLGMEIVQFKDPSFAPWQRALIDMIIASKALVFIPSSYSSSFAKTILFHRVKEKQKIQDGVSMHC
mmetsp:Transcript_6040/g.10991  ORF Transcript_6040/g.10991 Transcript_6040/m.10991 type:complete len:372 (+) Transcript_6040:70-1185(+)